ncbi:hypothetical protein BAU15_02110 [Enterococcus sp. JM4C]|nr:hypothetical protein BAU15_02110 [Enterococcus sp. JM4C]
MNDTFKGFFNCSTKEELVLFKEELWRDYPIDCQKLIKRSRRFVSGCYLFDNEWDMEKTQIPVYWQIAEIQWENSPNDDSEWNYMLNRHRFLVDVACAYLLTDEEVYRVYLEDFLRVFLKDNPLNEKTKTYSWRTIDVGLRLVNWIKIVEIHRFLPLFSEALYKELEQVIQQQADYLYRNLSIERGQSNWQVIEIAGLYSTSVAFSRFSDSQQWTQASLFYLEKSLELQVEEDGMQREQSFTYHNEVLLCVLEVCQLAQRSGREWPAKLADYLNKLVTAASIFVKPNGQQPAYGDSDEEDMTGILQYAEALVTKSTNKKGSPNFFAKLSLGRGSFPVENQFLLQSARHYFAQAGIMIVKKAGTYHLFKCGPLGGGHGHDDLLHFDWFYKGKDILVDSGRYSYEINKERLTFKAASAHNTIVVDQQNFQQHSDSWNSLKVATPINQRFIEKNQIYYMEGGHLGYFGLSDPVYVNRKILDFPEGFSLISDLYMCQSSHDVQTAFHFNSVDVRRQKQKFVSSDLEVEIISIDERAQLAIIDTAISPSYNELTNSKCGIVSKKIQGTDSNSYLLAPKGLIQSVKIIPVYSDGLELASSVVTAIKIDLQEGKQILVINQLQEPDNGRRAYQVEGQYYYGRVMVITDSDRVVLY